MPNAQKLTRAQMIAGAGREEPAGRRNHPEATAASSRATPAWRSEISGDENLVLVRANLRRPAEQERHELGLALGAGLGKDPL